MARKKYDADAFKEGETVMMYKPYTFLGKLVEEERGWTQVAVGTLGTVEGFDSGDGTWLVLWDRVTYTDGSPSVDRSTWTDPDCIRVADLSDEELREVYKLLGVDEA